MNLDNLKLVELNALEVQEVDGGINLLSPYAAWHASREFGMFAYGFVNGFLENL
ncbi:hypothetical protein CLU83_3233 [Flavobacterium sp. 1]|uniref:bacteriocin n=1 Tax=Flavobacterium sp. 1 TaxID=2035200 RepID=UPI000CC461B9|nr:bacteriocin [Flavobacterium sp. 1]PJJ09853.1 hypothetical protein CLU83_3233 [Flavobacterium sp. 1]